MRNEEASALISCSQHFIPADVDKGLGLKGGVDLNNDGVVSGDELVPITMGWFKKVSSHRPCADRASFPE